MGASLFSQFRGGHLAATLHASPYAASERVTPQQNPPERRRVAPWADALFSVLAHGAAWLTLLLLVGILISLLIGAAPAIKQFGLGFFGPPTGIRSKKSLAAW